MFLIAAVPMVAICAPGCPTKKDTMIFGIVIYSVLAAIIATAVGIVVSIIGLF